MLLPGFNVWKNYNKQHVRVCIHTLTCCLRGKGPVKRYKSHRQRKGREPLWQKKLLSESVDKVQTMAAEMREDKVKQLFFTDCAVSTSSVHYA